jgi:hypothetical protein
VRIDQSPPHQPQGGAPLDKSNGHHQLCRIDCDGIVWGNKGALGGKEIAQSKRKDWAESQASNERRARLLSSFSEQAGQRSIGYPLESSNEWARPLVSHNASRAKRKTQTQIAKHEQAKQ